jgi:hypothetical protein
LSLPESIPSLAAGQKGAAQRRRLFSLDFRQRLESVSGLLTT